MTGCKITMWNLPRINKGKGKGTFNQTCGKPVVGAHGLCERHEADRIRLGGAR